MFSVPIKSKPSTDDCLVVDGDVVLILDIISFFALFIASEIDDVLVDGVLVDGVLVDGVLVDGVLVDGVLVDDLLVDDLLVDGVVVEPVSIPST
jgi:hypothetical protein